MIDHAAMSPAAYLLVSLACALAAGCSGRGQVQTDPAPTAPQAATIPVDEPTKATVEIEPAPVPVIEAARPVQSAPAAGSSPVATDPVAAAPATPVSPPGAQPSKPAVPVAVAPKPTAPIAAAPKVAAPVAAAPKPAVPVAVAPKPAVAAATQPAAAPLDLKSLETRLRQTKAIGVLTKLSLKNQVDDLLEKFRAFHKRQGKATLADLRRNYDMLMLKVLSLLQDSDPPLARDIVRSRTAIWSILEDQRKFTDSNLMAGATP